MALSQQLQKQIPELVTSHQTVLFMKGSRVMPQCGFSATVVEILDEVVQDYETIDVLGSPELRVGLKEFSRWPTFPQLYVNGNFIGGCDIVREMHETGELRDLLGSPHSKSPTSRPEALDEPATVMSLTADELKSMLDRREVTLFDVRPENERAVAKIAQAHPLDEGGQELLFGLKPDAAIASHCHHGVRSQAVAAQLLREGFHRVYNLTGGSDAWSQMVAPTVPRY